MSYFKNIRKNLQIFDYKIKEIVKINREKQKRNSFALP